MKETGTSLLVAALTDGVTARRDAVPHDPSRPNEHHRSMKGVRVSESTFRRFEFQTLIVTGNYVSCNLRRSALTKQLRDRRRIRDFTETRPWNYRVAVRESCVTAVRI